MASGLFGRTLTRPCLASSSSVFRLATRAVHSTSAPTTSSSKRVFTTRRVGLAAGALLATGGLTTAVFADVKPERGEHDQMMISHPTPLSELVRAYVVYSMCSFPTLVDHSPKILSTLMAIPGISYITEAVVRATFFSQFVGADTAEECIPILNRLRAENKGGLFAYSVEVDENTVTQEIDTQPGMSATATGTVPPHKKAVAEILHSIDVAAAFEDSHPARLGGAQGRKTWVAIKITALLPDSQSLVNLSRYLVDTRAAPLEPVAFPGAPTANDLDVLCPWPPRAPPPQLTKGDLDALRELHDDLIKICERGKAKNIKLIMDAEYSWYTPAVDAFAHALMRRFNKPSADADSVTPLIYQTYQAYLHRTPAYLAHSFADARTHGYSLGVKLVRGAYHPHELAAHAARYGSGSNNFESHGGAKSPRATRSVTLSPELAPPVWLSKPETDACYNACIREIIKAVAEGLSVTNTADVSTSMSTPDKGGLFSRIWSTSGAGPVGSVLPTSPSAPVVGVLFGTHNRVSCDQILDQLVSYGLVDEDSSGIIHLNAEVAGRVTVGQLYGMHDDLSNYLVDKTRAPFPFVLKYLPYGGLREVMPYLARRGIENKSVLFDGAAAKERERAWSEIRQRIWN